MSELRGCYEVIGFRKVSYTRKADSKQVCGYEVSLSLCEPMEGQVGEPVESVWLSLEYAAYVPQLGQIVRKTYNRFGRVQDLIPVYGVPGFVLEHGGGTTTPPPCDH